MTETLKIDLAEVEIDLHDPTPLFQSGDHAIYWLGITEETAFRCNAYLVVDGDEAILVDPGNRGFFGQVEERVAQILDPSRVTGMVLCHQDPDVAASMVDWLERNPTMRIFSTARTHVLLPHYGRSDYSQVDVSTQPLFDLPTGAQLRFIEAPHLHFPGAFTTFDSASGFLFSGDIWAALDMNWQLTVKSMAEHIPMMDLFHVDYMASNIAARGFVARLQGVPVRTILPQHGSIIPEAHVPEALDYLRNLQCGTDIIYPNLS